MDEALAARAAQRLGNVLARLERVILDLRCELACLRAQESSDGSVVSPPPVGLDGGSSS